MTVWDSVLVNDEIDLLVLRCEVLEDVVDRFVVVEADRTFRGDPKPFHVEAAWERLERWRSKITLVRAELSVEPDPWPVAQTASARTPAEFALAHSAALAWAREHEQERAQRDVLAEAEPGDLLLLGDVDELPSPNVVAALAAGRPRSPVRLVQRQAVYRANWELPAPWADGTLALRGADISTHPMAQVMTGLPSPDLTGYREDEILDAGWHLTSLGTPDAVRRKLGSYSHVEFADNGASAVEMMSRAQQQRFHHLGLGSLRTLPAAELDDVQRRLLASRPDWFDFSPAPSSLSSDAYSLAIALDRAGRLPDRWRRAWAGGAMSKAAAGALAVGERLRRARRRRHPDVWAWKRGRTIELQDL